MKHAMVIKPTQSLEQAFDLPTLFLAGSIEMDQAENWQVKAEAMLCKHYVLFNPRRESWDSSWKQEMANPQFKAQVDWELDALEKADRILMYLAPGTKSPISLLELGLFAGSGKLVVCCPDGFWRKGNVEIVCSRKNIPLFHELHEAVAHLTGNK